MTWIVVRQQDGSAFVEHHALLRQYDVVVSRHPTINEARDALKAYRKAKEEEAAADAAQMSFFEERP